MIESSSEAGTMDPQSSMPSSPSSSSPPEGGGKRGPAAASPPPSNFFGKHRMAAAVSQLHHQIDIVKVFYLNFKPKEHVYIYGSISSAEKLSLLVGRAGAA